MGESDRALIEAVCMGSRDAFEEIMERYERLVYATSLAYAGNREDALDITQNVFTRVYEKMSSYRGSGSFKAWLLRITHNESLNWVRGHGGHRRHTELTAANSPDVEARQESDLVHAEAREHLAGALLDLNPKQRQAVVLRYFQKTSIREIASLLGCTEGTAKNILFRSLQKLRRKLGPAWKGA